MILQALYRHYQTLVKQGKLSEPGWDSGFKVSYALELNDAGDLVNVRSLMSEQEQGGKTVISPRLLTVPAHTTRTSGILANFLCDNSSYMLGADAKENYGRAAECFNACAELHREVLDGVDTPAALAILHFFNQWDPAAASVHPLLKSRWKELAGNANLIFSYEGKPVTEDPAIREAWQRRYDAVDPNAYMGQCLITGDIGPIAATHPFIKGVAGTKSSGAALVSFNAHAFCSYGHEQNLNAPIGTKAAFAYTAALNYLLSDRNHCRTVGDTTVVCWAEHGDSVYQDFSLSALFGPPSGTVDETELTGLLENLVGGMPIQWEGRSLAPGEHFYFLGIAPNAARLSVRFFVMDTMGDFAKNISRHYHDIDTIRPSFDTVRNLPVWMLAGETVNRRSRNKQPMPQLTGDLLSAVLMDTLYPATLLSGVQFRIRADHKVTRGRAAIIKGYYLRYYRNKPDAREKEVFTVELNESSTYQPYVLGRLFSVLEALQEAANPSINATIKDKYFNSASATPANVFPPLINLGQKHLRKLQGGLKIYYDRQITKLMGMIDETYPIRMTLPEQAAFQLGYYHQTQKRYEKEEENSNA